MGKLVKCKSCGAEIAKSAKTCPQCGAKRKRSVLGVILVVLGVLIVIGAIGSTASNDGPKKVGETDPAGPVESTTPIESTAPEQTVFTVGDQVEFDDVIVSLDNVRESSGSTYNKPSDGNVFLLCEFTIENNSTKDLSISSMLCFSAYVDDFSTNMSLSALIEKNGQQLDGAVAAGKKMNGEIGYEVPADYKTLEIHFTPDFWSGDDIVFTYSK